MSETGSEIAGVGFTSLYVHEHWRGLLHRSPDDHTSAVSARFVRIQHMLGD